MGQMQEETSLNQNDLEDRPLLQLWKSDIQLWGKHLISRFKHLQKKKSHCDQRNQGTGIYE